MTIVPLCSFAPAAGEFDPEVSARLWFDAARELACWPRAVTAEMRHRHCKDEHGHCAGPHGVGLTAWPCSTWTLADTADRLRVSWR